MLLAIVAAASAAWLLLPGRPDPKLSGPVTGATPSRHASLEATARSAWPEWASGPLIAAVLAGAAVSQLVDGIVGWVLGPLAAFGLMRWFRLLDEAPQRRRRDQVVRELPLVVDLLVACLQAGRAVDDALVIVADACPGPVSEQLRVASAQLALGGDPRAVWQGWGADPELLPLARAFARAARSGTSITLTLQQAATELRQIRRWNGQARARSVGVRTAAPLGLCFMPAFIVLGVVPTVIGTFSTAVL